MSIRFGKPQRTEATKAPTSTSNTQNTNGKGVKAWNILLLLVLGLNIAGVGFLLCLCNLNYLPVNYLPVWEDGIVEASDSFVAPDDLADPYPMAYPSRRTSSETSSKSSATGASSSSEVYDEPKPVSPYIDNRLSTGAVPYPNDYQSHNHYDAVRKSQIRVKTSSGSDRDVVVIVKYDGKFYYNAYIKAGGSYTFNVQNNNTFQVFFYYGKGWDPTKEMDEIRTGGFVESESFQKGSDVKLENQVLTYNLILTQNGKFSMQQSSKSEMFPPFW